MMFVCLVWITSKGGNGRNEDPCGLVLVTSEHQYFIFSQQYHKLSYNMISYKWPDPWPSGSRGRPSPGIVSTRVPPPYDDISTEELQAYHDRGNSEGKMAQEHQGG